MDLSANQPATLPNPSQKTQDHEGGLIKRATMAYIFALSVIAILSASAHFVLDHTIAEQADSATIIDIAGRQRMLSQRIALLATQTMVGEEGARSLLLKEAALMRRSHNALLNGNDLNIQHPLSADLKDFYSGSDTALDAQVEAFLDDASIVAQSQGAQEIGPAVKRIVDAARGPLLKTLNDAVKLFSREANVRINALRRLQQGVLFFLLFTLIAEGFLIFKPLVSKLNFYVVRLHTTATFDSLTNLPTRRAFMEASTKSFKNAHETGQSVTSVVVDIDHFKAINDTYGHAVGDEALKAFAAIFRSMLRSDEVYGRIGGEEFAITLSGADEAHGANIAERLRLAIEQRPADDIPRFTISCGVAQMTPDETLEECLNRADQQLYAAKRNGRNQVAISGEA